MNSIINLTGSGIIKSFVEIKKDGATFDVPLTSVLGDFAIKTFSENETTAGSPYILDFSKTSSINFVFNNDSDDNFIKLQNPIIGKIYNMITNSTTFTLSILFGDNPVYLNGNVPAAGTYFWTIMFDGQNWYATYFELFIG